VTWPSIQYSIQIQMAVLKVNIVNTIHYSIQIQMAVLKVNIVNTHSRYTLTIPVKLQYEP
jgi:hypothetical protein